MARTTARARTRARVVVAWRSFVAVGDEHFVGAQRASIGICCACRYAHGNSRVKHRSRLWSEANAATGRDEKTANRRVVLVRVGSREVIEPRVDVGGVEVGDEQFVELAGSRLDLSFQDSARANA